MRDGALCTLMIDTVGFYISLRSDDYNILINQGVMTQRIDRDTGFVEFEYTNFKLSHSWNYKTLWRVDNKHIVWDPVFRKYVEASGVPYLRIEFSVPKILWGHNLWSSDIDGMISACAIVRDAFEKYSGVYLEGPGEWYPYRIDTCANFIMVSKDQVKSYIRYLQRLDYPRRRGTCFKDTGLYFASRHNTAKAYCKGEEFRKNDAKDRFLDELERLRLQKFADTIFRFEVENKRRLKYDVSKYEIENNETLSKFKGYVSFDDLLSVVNLSKLTGVVMKKFLCGKESQVMKSLDVLNILKSVCGVRQANNFYSVYMVIVTQGQDEAKRQFKRRNYYEALKAFRENGISLITSDIQKMEDFKGAAGCEDFFGRGFPSDFSMEMLPDNKYYQMPKCA